MRISTVKGAKQTNFIEVVNCPNSILNMHKDAKPTKTDFTIGFWKIKYIDKVPKEYEKTPTFDIHNV